MGETGAAARDDVQVPGHVELTNLDFLQSAMFDLPIHAHAGNDRDAHAHLNEALNTLDGRHFHRHVERRTMTRKKLDNATPEGGFDDMGDEVLFAELFDFDFPLFSQGMLRRNDEGEFVFENLCGQQLRIARDKGNGTQVEAVIDDLVGNVAGEHAMEPDLDPGVGLPEACKGWEQGVDGAFIDAERELTALEAFEFHQALLDLVAEIQEAFGVFAEECTGIGKADGAGATYEKGLAERVLEFADSEADSGLGAVEAFGRPGEAAFTSNGQKDLQFS